MCFDEICSLALRTGIIGNEAVAPEYRSQANSMID